MTAPSYPGAAGERDAWILARRGAKHALDPRRPYAFLREDEPGPGGATRDTATVFLTNRECPFRCLMCDLWRNTLDETVPPGAIAEQIRYALRELYGACRDEDEDEFEDDGEDDSRRGRQLKLYNAGNFFDPNAIPPGEYAGVARLASRFTRVIVECHPALVGRRCLEFRDLLGKRGAALEVAIGLETADEAVLARLNKRMTLEQFRRAAGDLTGRGIDLRVFILVRAPWQSEAEGVEWACRSIDLAFDCGAAVCSLIPTRAGNGAMETLQAAGLFAPPSLRSLEAAVEYGLGLRRGRVFADLWDIERFAACPDCSRRRIERLRAMNQAQTLAPGLRCERCHQRER